MLNLTNSFYRYLKLASENLFTKKGFAKSFPHQLCYWSSTFRNKLFVISSERASTLVESNQRCRFYTNKKSKINIKKLLCNINQSKREKPMNYSLQPTTSHVSHGGHFQITDTGEEPASAKPWAGEEQSSPPPPSRVLPNFRTWEPVIQKIGRNHDSGFKFRIISYNVLAQYLLESHSYLYRTCSPKDLKWNVRAARLYEEIRQLEPDILCLQEVQENHLSSFYDKFKHLGYCGVYKQKTGHRQDGCAIYFKESVFSLQDYVTVEYFQPELPILNRDNIALIVKLVPKCNPESPLIVATTHLLFNPRRTDVRLAQLQVLLAEIDRFSFICKDNVGVHLPVIVTGDLNSLPDSAVIKLLDRGYVRVESFRDASDWKRIGVTDSCQHLAVLLDRKKGHPQTVYKHIKIQNTDYESMYSNEKQMERDQENYNNLFNNEFVCHSLNLVSVYDRLKCDGEHEATTFQDYWVTVDYIYFSRCGNLKLLERLRLPTASECEVLGCLPNEVYGSDHLALGAVFEMTTNAPLET